MTRTYLHNGAGEHTFSKGAPEVLLAEAADTMRAGRATPQRGPGRRKGFASSPWHDLRATAWSTSA